MTLTQLIRCFYPIRIVKKITCRPEDLQRVTPISNQMGFDLGTSLDRYYLEQFLARHRDRIHGNILEIGGDEYAKKFGAAGSQIDVLHYTSDNPRATIIGDLTRVETLPQNCFDCFICPQTYNFIPEYELAIKNSAALLKDDGILLASVAGVCHRSRYDSERWGDYWRFMPQGVTYLFQKYFRSVTVRGHGNVLAAKLFLDGIPLESVADHKLLDHEDPDYPIIITVAAQK